MTQDDVIRLAIQAWEEAGEGWVVKGWFEDRRNAFEAFAKLVAAEVKDALDEQHMDDIWQAIKIEREACAKLVDYWEAREGEHADAIRARGKQ